MPWGYIWAAAKLTSGVVKTAFISSWRYHHPHPIAGQKWGFSDVLNSSEVTQPVSDRDCVRDGKFGAKPHSLTILCHQTVGFTSFMVRWVWERMLRTYTATHSSAVGNSRHAGSDLSYCWMSLWENIYGNKKRDWFLCLLVSATLVCAPLAPCFLLPCEAENHSSWSVWKRGLLNSWGQETEWGRCWGPGATFKGISPRWPISSK